MEELNRQDLLLYIHASAAFQTLYAGVEFGVFEALHQSALNSGDLTILTSLEPQSTRALLFGLSSLRLIEKEGIAYKNSEIIELLFKRNEYGLFKKWILLQANITYIGQTDYIESLRQDTNAGIWRFDGKGETIYQRLESNLKLRDIFYNFMEAYSEYAIHHLIDKVDFSKDKFVLDVGGGGGINAIAIAKRNPHLKITLLELLVAKPIAEEKINNNDLKNNITFLEGDMFNDDFPENQDIVLFIHQLVIWSPEQNRLLLKKAFNCLNEGGRVIIFSSISEDSEDKPLMAALDTVYFKAIASGNGMIYPWKDYEKMLLDAGFKYIKKIKCDTWTPHGIVIGYK